MTRILVVYGTTDGHTASIARRLGEALTRHGVLADVVQARETGLRPAGYDGVIVAASVHGGVYQPVVRRWVRRHAAVLDDMPTAFVSVSLGLLQAEPAVRNAVEDIVSRFLRETGWRPTLTQSVAGAVLFTKYGWLKRRLMRRIVAKAGGPTDTTRDHVFTDWEALDRFARSFAHEVEVDVHAGAREAVAPTERGAHA
jgi:menaquinone-dependent protoporphyrinogen oxidase